jgi:tetratricopeptide (TPR) repeat protein
MSHLYEKLSAVRRIRLHQHASAVFRQLYSTREEEGAAIIVHHLLQGNVDPQQIARYAELAGDHSYALAAYPAAESYYRLAIEQQGHSQQTVSSKTETQLHLASLLECLGECMRFQGRFEGAGRCFEEALALHRQVYPSLSSLSGKEKLQEAQIQAMLCCGIGISWYDRDDCLRARQYYTSVEHLLYEVGIVDGPVWAYLFLQYSYINWHEGKHPEAQKAAQTALVLFEATLQQNRPPEQLLVKTRLRRTLAGDPVDLGRTYLALGLPAGATGQLSETISYLTTSLQIFEHYDCLREIAIVCCNLGDVYLRRAEYPSAEQYLLRALDITTRIGDTALQCFVTGNLGLLALRTDKLIESENWYRRGLKSAFACFLPFSHSSC